MIRLGEGDKGSASVFAAFTVAALMVVVGAAMWLSAVVAARHQAQAAADLGALEGAQQVAIGAATAACDLAAHVVARNGAHMDRCEIEGGDVVVQASRPVEVPLGSQRYAVAVARAGPG